MIDTVMALWNRGHGGRGVRVTMAFFLICISISLLLVSVGSSWVSLFFHRPQVNDRRSVISAAELTATAQSNAFQPVASDTVTIYAPKATATSNPCPTTTLKMSRTPSLKGSATIYGGHDGSGGDPTPMPPRPRPTSTPVKVTPTPRATPSPTHTPTPTPAVTPTVTETPTNTPTPAVTPTVTETPTPTVTPTNTPTPAVTPTATETPAPTVTPTDTPGTTPTAMTSPTANVTITSPTHLRGITPIAVSTPTISVQNGGNTGSTSGTWSTTCVRSRIGDSVEMASDSSMIATLRGSVWIILGGTGVGTLLFYGIVYMLMRRKSR